MSKRLPVSRSLKSVEISCFHPFMRFFRRISSSSHITYHEWERETRKCMARPNAKRKIDDSRAINHTNYPKMVNKLNGTWVGVQTQHQSVCDQWSSCRYDDWLIHTNRRQQLKNIDRLGFIGTECHCCTKNWLKSAFGVGFFFYLLCAQIHSQVRFTVRRTHCESFCRFYFERHAAGKILSKSMNGNHKSNWAEGRRGSTSISNKWCTRLLLSRWNVHWQLICCLHTSAREEADYHAHTDTSIRCVLALSCAHLTWSSPQKICPWTTPIFLYGSTSTDDNGIEFLRGKNKQTIHHGIVFSLRNIKLELMDERSHRATPLRKFDVRIRDKLRIWRFDTSGEFEQCFENYLRNTGNEDDDEILMSCGHKWFHQMCWQVMTLFLEIHKLNRWQTIFSDSIQKTQ